MVRVGYVCIFDDGTEGRASAAPDPPVFQFGADSPIALDAHLLFVHGRIANGAYHAVGRGADDPIRDVGVWLTRGSAVPTILKPTRGPNSIYLEPDGTPSWVPVDFDAAGRPVYVNEVRYADGRAPTSARDFSHPYAPTNAIEEWHGERVVIHGEADPWVLAESALAPNGHTRILIRNRATGEVRIVWDTPTSFTSTPSQIAVTPLGPVVAINHPNDGMSYFRYPSHMKSWEPYVPPVPEPDEPDDPEPQPEPVDCTVSEWSDWTPWSALNATTEQRTRARTVTTQPAHGGAACPELVQTETRAIVVPPEPKKRPWWHKLIDFLLTLRRGGQRP